MVRWLCHQESRGHAASTNQTVRLHNLCQLVWEHGCLFGIRAGLRLCAFVCPHTCVYAHSCKSSQQLFKAFKAGRKKTTGVNVGIHSAHSLLIFYKSTWGQLLFLHWKLNYFLGTFGDLTLDSWLTVLQQLCFLCTKIPPNLVFIHELWVLNKSLTLCSIAVFFFLCLFPEMRYLTALLSMCLLLNLKREFLFSEKKSFFRGQYILLR